MVIPTGLEPVFPAYTAFVEANFGLCYNRFHKRAVDEVI